MTSPRQTSDAPSRVGLCPAEHMGRFYMPLEAGDSTICPECDQEMIIYVRGSRFPEFPPEVDPEGTGPFGF